jgi:hypothetical protein
VDKVAVKVQHAVTLVKSDVELLVRDVKTLFGTNKNVQFWSIAICIMEVAISLFTVFFIRRLFTVNDKKFSQRPT